MSKSKCNCCGLSRVGPIRKWRRDTQYIESELNYWTCCIHCIRDDDYHMHWDWKEYYSSIGYPNSKPYRERSAGDYVKE